MIYDNGRGFAVSLLVMQLCGFNTVFWIEDKAEIGLAGE